MEPETEHSPTDRSDNPTLTTSSAEPRLMADRITEPLCLQARYSGQGCLERVSPRKVTVIRCDMAINVVDEYLPEGMSDELDARDRGGLAFRPVFEHVAKLDETPACMIYFTDGGTRDDPDEPDYPVMWALTNQGHYQYQPRFGEKVVLS